MGDDTKPSSHRSMSKRIGRAICLLCNSTTCEHTVAIVRLSLRDRSIIAGLARAQTNESLRADLGLSIGTVKQCVSQVLRKLRLKTRGEITVWALAHPELWQ